MEIKVCNSIRIPNTILKKKSKSTKTNLVLQNKPWLISNLKAKVYFSMFCTVIIMQWLYFPWFSESSLHLVCTWYIFLLPPNLFLCCFFYSIGTKINVKQPPKCSELIHTLNWVYYRNSCDSSTTLNIPIEHLSNSSWVFVIG